MNRKRAFFPFLFILLSFFSLGVRLFILQIWHHDELNACVDRLVTRERPELPCRGMIMDREGRIMAMSLKSYSLFADMTMMRNPRQVADGLKSLRLPVPPALWTAPRTKAYVPLVSNLDLDKMQRLKAMRLPCLGFSSDYRRQYPEGRLACHLLGIVGRDGGGLDGVENSMNSYLSGEKINQKRYRDARGREIAEKLVDPEKLRGADVYLTIDRNLQFIAEQEIERAWKAKRARKVMAIIQDPNTGEILAMASRPDYDPADPGSSVTNPVISDVFEPGSTFKLVTAAASIEEKTVKPEERIWCENGSYSFMGHTINDHEKKGMLNLEEIMEYSSNIGTAKLGQRLGKDSLYRYIRQFGFYCPTGIDLPGEGRGLLKEPEQWSGLSLPIISFGQEIGVTAIQVINAYSAILNGGMLMEPKVVREVRDPSGETLYRSESRAIRRVVSVRTAEILKKVLVSVVDKGTGQMAKIPGFSVGGKTGTAQKRDPSTGRYSSRFYTASFCGGIPMSKPRLTIFVLIDDPQGDYYASSSAAPVFEKIASRAVHYLKLQPDREPLQVCSVPLRRGYRQ